MPIRILVNGVYRLFYNIASTTVIFSQLGQNTLTKNNWLKITVLLAILKNILYFDYLETLNLKNIAINFEFLEKM